MKTLSFIPSSVSFKNTLFWLLLMLPIAPTVLLAAPQPAIVRIATFAYIDKGEIKVGGNSYYGRVVQEKWLERELAKRGIKLEWVPISGDDTGPIINEDFASKRIDFATYGDLPSIILNASGVHTRVIVPNGHGMDVYLVVPSNSTANSLRDLEGKRISVHRSRPWELSMIKLFAAEGLEARKDFRIINMQPQAGAAALAGGNVDGLFTLQAYTLEDKKIGRIIWSSRELPVAKMRAELWGADEFTRKYPEVSQIVATAFVRAQYWASQQQNRESVILDGTRNGTPESVVRRTVDDPNMPWKDRFSPLFDDLLRAQYRNDLDIAHSKGLIRRKPDVDDLIDTRFVTVAIQELGLQGYWKPWYPDGAH